ncbi:MAG: phosphotransferase [Pseudomonadota bacterium]|nr:phosphotransferase [Pseudomonadota bacterium]
MEKETRKVVCSMKVRSTLVHEFLAKFGWHKAERELLAVDASFRRYERLKLKGETAVLMDAPPPEEDVKPFIKITKHLLKLGYSAPKIFAHDIGSGLLLLEDFGDSTFTNAFAAGADENKLYKSAVDVLIDLHCREPLESVPRDIEPYDNEKLIAEVMLFVDWYLKDQLGDNVQDELRDEFIEIWQELFSKHNFSNETLVLRDFHADNLMWLENRIGIQKCGLLDYQDAVRGHPAYDLMSLLEDARRDLQPSLINGLLDYYYSAIPGSDQKEFRNVYAILAAQRHCKVIGIFSRLAVRDGKCQYLVHIPRCWSLLEQVCLTPELALLKDWLNNNISPQIRASSIQNV